MYGQLPVRSTSGAGRYRLSSDMAPSAAGGGARVAGVEGMVGQSSSPMRPPPGAGPRTGAGGFEGAAEVPGVTREEEAPLANDEVLAEDVEDEVVDEEVVWEDVTLISPASPPLPAARLTARRRAAASGLRRDEPQPKDPPGGGVGETPAAGAMVVSTDQEENVDGDEMIRADSRGRARRAARSRRAPRVCCRSGRVATVARASVRTPRAGDECSAGRARASKTCREPCQPKINGSIVVRAAPARYL